MNINQTKRKHGKILYIVIILTLIFIWGNSLLNAEISSYISDFFKDIILSVFPFVPSGEAEGTGGVVRKLAHITEFAILGVELSLFFQPLKDRNNKKYINLVFCGFATAFVDETIQLFIPGRAGLVSDIWIDLCGFATGCIVYSVIYIAKNKRNKSQETKND